MNSFTNKNICSGAEERDVYYCDEEPKFQESIAERTKMKRQNQDRQGLKILTPQQSFCRLPVSLTELNTRNNSEKNKNEIRQLLYSLYCLKKLFKTIYKYLISII